MFSEIYSWFKSIFSYVAKTFIGEAAEELSDAAVSIVSELEKNPHLSGKEKFKRAEEALSGKYPSAESAAINLAIEVAVAIVRDQLSK